MSEPMHGKPHDFMVRLDGLKLDEATSHRIAGAIQAVVISELGKLDLTGGQHHGSLAYIPKDWLGIWLRQIPRPPEGFGTSGRPQGFGER